MTDRTTTDNALESLFAEAQQTSPVPDAALLARIEADANRTQPSALPLSPTRPMQGWWREVIQGLGGWPALGGLATATVAGVWLGVNPPVSMAMAAESYFGVEAVSPLVDMAPDSLFDLRAEAL